MFYYFFNAYKNEIYKKRNKITWKKIRLLKPAQKVILLGMVACLIAYAVCILFFKNVYWSIASFGALVIIALSTIFLTEKYDMQKNNFYCQNYKESEIEEVKKLLKRSEFTVFNSENGIDFLIEACQEIQNNKSVIEIIATSVVNIIKIIAVPIAIAFYSVQINNMPADEAAGIAIVIVILLVLIIGFFRMTFVPIEDIIKKDSNIAAKLSDSLKYIRLTVKTDTKKTLQLII